MKLRDYQEETIQSFFNYYEAGHNGNIVAALPTGTGKTPIISGFVHRVMQIWPNQRFLIMSHVKELLTQNYETLLRFWPNAPVGVLSAGLNQKDTAHGIILGGVASVVNSVKELGWRDICIVDECHLISPDEGTMYQTIINGLKEINPNLKVIGLSATPFRMGQGMITDGGLFHDICIDLTGIHAFNRFIAEGYLAPLIPKRTTVEIDVSDIKIVKGDFAKNQLDGATEKVLYEALKETMQHGYDRNCWLVFCSGIKPSEHAAEILNSFGITATAIHSKINDTECEKRYKAFKNGEIRAIVGNNKFTTGFDHPPIDLIVMLRPTASPGLWVQMLGRGTRPYHNTNPNFPYFKSNTIVLDFAGNCKRLGPINDPVIPRKRGEKTGDIPIKVCDAVHDGVVCGIYNHASARYCGGKPEPSAEGCGAEFKFKTKLVGTAGNDALIKGDMPTIETIDVDRVIYHRHQKIGTPPSIRVSYFNGLTRYTEWVCLEHQGFARTKAIRWWRQRHETEPPTSVDAALEIVSQLRVPKRIRVRTDLKFPEILDTEW